MALPKFEKDIAYVSKLDDHPTDADGMSAAEFKGVFDQAGQEIQQYINDTLIPEVESEIQMAAEGERPGGNLNGDVLAVGSVTGDKLAYKTVTQDKIGTGAVGSTELASSAVTTDKLALKAVSSRNIAEKAVENEHLSADAVNSANIKNGAVSNTKLAAESVSEDKITPNAVTKEKIKPGSTYTAIRVVLAVGAWANNQQAVTASGVRATDMKIISPDVSSFDAYCEAGVRCTGASNDTLVFTCTHTPTASLTAYVCILR